MTTKPQYSLAQLAKIVDVEFNGDPDTLISGIATLQHAQAGDISFLDNSRYRKYLADTRASVVILSQQDALLCPVAALITRQPYVIYARIAALFNNRPTVEPGIHPSAVIGNGCQIHPTVSIGPHCVIGDNVIIGEGSEIMANSTIGPGCSLGSQCILWSNVALYHGVTLGNRVQIHSGTVIGSDGFGNANDAGAWIKVPQLGGVVIGDDVEIGAATTIDRGALGDTIIENGVRLDNQIQVGHNVRIGAHTAIAACTGISGSVKIGKHCLISGMVGFTGHFEVADNVVVTGMTVVSKSLTKPGVYSSGTAIEPHAEWRKNAVRFRQLDAMAKKLIELEKQLAELKGDNKVK